MNMKSFWPVSINNIITRNIFSPTNLWQGLVEGSGIYKDQVECSNQESCSEVLQPNQKEGWPGDHQGPQAEQESENLAKESARAV
jgi:hypothetical protein